MIMGYTDKLSVRAEDRIRFMVSTEAKNYRADLVRLVHGDTNPQGPGFKEEVLVAPFSGEYAGKNQPLHPGSYISVDAKPALKIGNNFSFFVGDVAQRDNIKSLLSEASKEVGMPDILVHAAGLNPRQTAHEVTSEEWDKTLGINLSAPFFLSRAAISVMKERGWGRIVNFASLQSTRAFPGGLAYGASKGGIVQLTRAMAEEWSGDGICVNAIGPGFFPTELTKAVFDDAERAERKDRKSVV